MPDYIISGRVPFEDEDDTHVITGCASEDEAMLKFKALLYDNNPAAAARWKERHGDMGEFKDDPWPAYVTDTNVSWESDLLSKCREIIKAYDDRGYGIGEEMVELAELLDKVEGKENDGFDVEQNSEG